jgi:hypothetical protein
MQHLPDGSVLYQLELIAAKLFDIQKVRGKNKKDGITMTRNYFGLALCTLVLPSILTAVEPVRRTVVPEITVDYSSGVPMLVNNRLIVSKYHCESESCSTVRMLDLATRTWREINPWPPEPTAVLVIKKVVPLDDGRIVVGLRAISFDNQRAEIVATFDKAGKRTGWFRTNPYAWGDFAVDKDGSVWMFGFCPDYVAASCGTDYGTVRHYSLAGDLLDSFLPYNAFPDGALLVPKQDVLYTYFFLAPERIGVYVDPTSEWIQIDRKGTVLSREKLSLPEIGNPFRLGMNPEGRLVLSGNGLASLKQWNSQHKAFEDLPDRNGAAFLGVHDGNIVMADFFPAGKPLALNYYDFQ